MLSKIFKRPKKSLLERLEYRILPPYFNKKDMEWYEIQVRYKRKFIKDKWKYPDRIISEHQIREKKDFATWLANSKEEADQKLSHLCKMIRDSEKNGKQIPVDQGDLMKHYIIENL